MKLSKQQALHGTALVSDPRFARLHFDPRFQRVAKRNLKLPIDSRFRHMFSDKSFSDPLSLDKRGKPKKKRRTQQHPLHQYYKLEEEALGHPEHGQHEPISDTVVAAHEDRVSGSPKESALERNADATPRKRKRIDHSTNNKSSGRESKNRKSVSDDRFDEVAVPNSKKQSGVSTDDTSEEDPEDADSDESARSSETESSTSSSVSDSEQELDEVTEATEEAEEENVPVTEQETRRLALVSMDWDHIKAIDILVVMNSFLPKGGKILSVSVYPSEFGLQQMKEETRQGPKAVFESDGSDEETEGTNDGINMEKLRQYEKAKLRYYYAVIECDSCATADFLYKSCDGMEFERTSNTLDLRFIPDDMKFQHNARDMAMEVPSDYEAPVFETRVLQHSNVKLTWDDDEPDRVKTLHQKYNTEQLNEMDFKAYLASDASDDEGLEASDAEGNLDNIESNLPEDEAGFEDLKESQTGNGNGKKKLIHKYRALLLESDGVLKSKENRDKDMEITFHSGLEELSKRLIDKKKQLGNETVWEAYLRKKKERKKGQKKEVEEEDVELESADEQQSADPFFAQDNVDFDDPFFKSEDEALLDDKLEPEVINSKKGSTNHAKPTSRSNKEEKAIRKEEIEKKKIEEERSRAELELLLADECAMENGMKGYNLKKKKLKGKRKTVDKISEKLPTVNYDDPRFSALFTSHHFAVDPTDPEFKRSAAQLRSVVQKQQRQLSQVDKNVADPSKGNAENIDDSRVVALKKTDHELSLMVRSLKRKVSSHV